MREPTNGERLPHRKWISIADQLPPDKCCVEVASHQVYGLANWSKEKGFYELFYTYGPHEEAEYAKNQWAWNGEIMWWRAICAWPYYGEQGCDAETMKGYERE